MNDSISILREFKLWYSWQTHMGSLGLDVRGSISGLKHIVYHEN
jgi:hypothetical protein